MRPVIVSIGSVQIHAYTVCMLAAVLIGGWMTYNEARRRGRLDHRTIAVGAWGLMGGVLGAKLSMLVFLGPERFWRLLPTIPSQGAAFTAALFGGYVAVVIAERHYHVERCAGDLVAPFLPLGQVIGRLGNFLAGDAYGLPTSSQWSVYMAGANRYPVQLYELVWTSRCSRSCGDGAHAATVTASSSGCTSSATP
jgi:phosphatidylglycerol:prolipoprotein diacylglycerol transferase